MAKDAKTNDTIASANDAVEAAKDYLKELAGQECESIAGVHREDHSWIITAVVLELRRIPVTTDILGTYEIRIGDDGELLKYRRLERYYRNQALGESRKS